MWERSGWVVVHHGWWPGIFGELIPLLFLVAALAFGVWAVRRITDGNRLVVAGGPTPAPAGADGALQELRLRYARGDVDRDEFTQRLHDLGGEGPEPPPPPPPAAA